MLLNQLRLLKNTGHFTLSHRPHYITVFKKLYCGSNGKLGIYLLKMEDCAASASFCPELRVKHIKVQSVPGLKLLEKLAKYPVHNVGIIGAGETSDDLDRMNLLVFHRDFPQLAGFTGKEKIGVVFVPKSVIPKYPINLFPDQLNDAVESIKIHAPMEQELQKRVATAKQAFPGERPEYEVFDSLEKALENCDGVLVIHSSDLRNPDLLKSEVRQEFDFFVLDSKTATVFSIEAKKTLSFRITGKKKEKQMTVAQKVGKQLRLAYEYMRDWFGADIAAVWSFKPMIYCRINELENLCENCTESTACGTDDFIEKFMSYRRKHMKNFSDDLQMRIVEDFKLMARFLLFGLAARELPTTANYMRSISKYMNEVGSWESIKLWCFLTPNQMEVLTYPYVVFCSGWGGGKTITGIEAVKRWSDDEMDVLVLLNAIATENVDILLFHHLKNVLRKWKPEHKRNGNITVTQIDFDNVPQDKLLKLTECYDCVFIDEFPGILNGPGTNEYLTKLIKAKIIFRNKKRAWISISNYDMENETSLAEMHEATNNFFEHINVGYLDQPIAFKIFKGLNLNLRNPSHIKDCVDASSEKFDEKGRNLSNETIQALNVEMRRPSNFIGNVSQNPRLVLGQIFVEKNIQAIVVARNQDDACMFGVLLLNLYGIDAAILSKWTSSPEEKSKVQLWMKGEKHNLLVTSKKFVNGFECETIISVEDVDEDSLGDVISRATSQFIPFQDFKDFLMNDHFYLTSCMDGAMDFLDSFASKEMKVKIAEVLWTQIIQLFEDGLPFSKEEYVNKIVHEVQDPCPTGLMRVLFGAVTIAGVCIQLIANDFETNKETSLTFCSPDYCHGCEKKLTMGCSVTSTFLFLLKNVDDQGKRRKLPSFDLYQCLKFVRAKHYGYTVLPNDEVARILVNDDDSLILAVERTYRQDYTVLFVSSGEAIEICKALYKRLKSNDLRSDFIFKNAYQLSKFLKGESKSLFAYLKDAIDWRPAKSKRYMVIDFTDDPNIFTSIDPELRQLLCYFKCPLTSTATSKAQEMLSSDRGQLCEVTEVAIKGPRQIRLDPLNLLEVTDHVLEKPLGQKMQFMFFLESGLDVEHDIQFCILPMLQCLGLNNASEVSQFENFLKQLWSSMKDWNVKTSLSKRTFFKRIFQKMASTFQQRIQVTTIVILESQDDSEPKKMNIYSKIYHASPGTIGVKQISIVHIFDEKLERNGFLINIAKEFKVLVVGGNTEISGFSASNKVELITDAFQKYECNDLASEIGHATGGLILDEPFICGGRSNGSYHKKCLKLARDGTWHHFATMNTARSFASAIVVQNKIWVAGGFDGSNYLKTTELLSIDGDWSTGPDLPEPLSEHTTVQINNQIIIIGGSNGREFTNVTRIFDMGLSFQKEGPPLKHRRTLHGCCAVKSSNHGGRQVIIVAGGDGTSRSVELWDVKKPGSSWQEIKDLPEPMIWRPALYPDIDGEGVIIIYREHSYKLQIRNGDYTYKRLDWQLQNPRHSFVSMMIPKECAVKCKPRIHKT